jgi:hypothetical protein
MEGNMKKRIILAIAFLALFAAAVTANQLALGYNNEGPTARFKWDDSIVSELSVSIDYSSTPGMNTAADNSFAFVFSPISLALYRGPFGDINIGFKFRDVVHYKREKDPANGEWVTRFNAYDYSLYLMFPELELSVPGVENMKLIGSLGIKTSWNYAYNGKLEAFTMGLYGISIANLGIVYYFDLKGADAATAVPQPAATAVPAPQAEPEKENTVK